MISEFIERRFCAALSLRLQSRSVGKRNAVAVRASSELDERFAIRFSICDGLVPTRLYGVLISMVSTTKIGVSAPEAAGEEPARFMLRIPPDLHARIVNRAQANGRSMNAEISAILTEAVGERGELAFRYFLREWRRTFTELGTALNEALSLKDRLDVLMHEISDQVEEAKRAGIELHDQETGLLLNDAALARMESDVKETIRTFEMEIR